MMIGEVNEDIEAIVPLTVRGPDRRQVTVQAVVDTGYNDYLVLPLATVAMLGLPPRDKAEYTLADNSVVLLDVFRAEALWHGQWQGVLVAGSRGGALIGMALLLGSDLRVPVVVGGQVVVQPLT